MAEGRGGNAGLAFIVGAVVVVVAIIAWFVFGGGMTPQAPTKSIDVDVSVPEVPAPSAG
jgi:hypothetical protein